MAISKYIERLVRINDLIIAKNTGNTCEFAEKLGLSRRQLLSELKELKDLGIPMNYDKYAETYYFSEKTTMSKLFRSNLNYTHST